MSEEMNINKNKKKFNIQQNINNKGRLIWELEISATKHCIEHLFLK